MVTPPEPSADLSEILAFALMIDGYDAMSLDDGLALARRVQDALAIGAFAGTEEELRLALFFTQRKWRWGSEDPESPHVDLMRAIIGELRRRAA